MCENNNLMSQKEIVWNENNRTLMTRADNLKKFLKLCLVPNLELAADYRLSISYKVGIDEKLNEKTISNCEGKKIYRVMLSFFYLKLYNTTEFKLSLENLENNQVNSYDVNMLESCIN